MTEHRWSKFWWQDWQADQALRSCSLAARGLWMDMLCIAHTGTPRGHVTINGATVTPKRLATLAGTSERECNKLLAELREAGVFSETPEGVIYSRRMIRDTEQAEAGREAIGKRWGKRDDPTPDPITPPNSPPTGGPSTLEAEAEVEAESKKEKSMGLPYTSDAAPVDNSPPQQPQWPPDPHPSAVTARLDQVVVRLRGNARGQPFLTARGPVRGVDEQIAAVDAPKVRAKVLTPEQLAEARRMAGRGVG